MYIVCILYWIYYLHFYEPFMRIILLYFYTGLPIITFTSMFTVVTWVIFWTCKCSDDSEDSENDTASGWKMLVVHPYFFGVLQDRKYQNILANGSPHQVCFFGICVYS